MHARVGEGQRERRQRIPSRLHAVRERTSRGEERDRDRKSHTASAEPNAGLKLMNREIMT